MSNKDTKYVIFPAIHFVMFLGFFLWNLKNLDISNVLVMSAVFTGMVLDDCKDLYGEQPVTFLIGILVVIVGLLTLFLTMTSVLDVHIGTYCLAIFPVWGVIMLVRSMRSYLSADEE